LLRNAPHVAADFADDIEAAVKALVEHPYSAQMTDHEGVRRKYIRRFRYAIFYRIDTAADQLIILSVRHAARRWPWQ